MALKSVLSKYLLTRVFIDFFREEKSQAGGEEHIAIPEKPQEKVVKIPKKHIINYFYKGCDILSRNKLFENTPAVGLSQTFRDSRKFI